MRDAIGRGFHLGMTAERDCLVTVWITAMVRLKLNQRKIERDDFDATRPVFGLNRGRDPHRVAVAVDADNADPGLSRLGRGPLRFIGPGKPHPVAPADHRVFGVAGAKLRVECLRSLFGGFTRRD